jgi:hypothetical protein
MLMNILTFTVGENICNSKTAVSQPLHRREEGKDRKMCRVRIIVWNEAAENEEWICKEK